MLGQARHEGHVAGHRGDVTGPGGQPYLPDRKPDGRPALLGSWLSEYGVFAMQMGSEPNPRAPSSSTLRAMEEIIADPQKGLGAAIRQVPELAKNRELELAILEATIEAWQSPWTKEHGLGAINPQAWADSLAFMKSLPEDLVPNPVTVDQLIDPSLLPAR